jgi:catechol 2,3-dioxygenase-like lactoylglutathione lyase family enzyme
MRSILCFLVLASPVVAQDAVVTRLAGAAFTVADIGKARQFYTELLGFEEAFDLKDTSGKLTSVFVKVNDDQYLEFAPGEVDGCRLDRLMLLTPNLHKARTALTNRRIAASEMAKAPDGTEYFSVHDPDRMEIRFVSYVRDSRQAELRGKDLTDRRVTSHLHHVALAADSEAASMAIFKEALGMQEFSRGPSSEDLRWINLSLPGSSGDLVEFMVLKSQPPAARQHIGFEVSNIQETFKQLTSRGLKQQNRPFAAAIGRWIWFIRDPNNIRIEFMGQPTEKSESK